MVTCSAPGKVILFGEHAVVYGKTAVAVAIDRRLYCSVERSDDGQTRVNGHPISETYHGYTVEAIRKVDIREPLNITTSSDIYSGAGLGSSAAVTIATLGALHRLKGEAPEEEDVARQGFHIECKVQGSASPIDTSTCTHGGAILVSSKKLRNFLWKMERGGTSWNVHEGSVPGDMTLVVGYTGVHAPTSPLVTRVRNFCARNTFARDMVNEIGEVVDEGCSALERGDLERVGELMNRNHKLLKILGVSHPKLDSLVKASGKYSYGAKLTGAGGGGSMIALTDRPEKVAKIISLRGGVPFVSGLTHKGLSLEKDMINIQ